MKTYELLDIIGEVNEDYVLAAGNNVTRPRFGWKKLAACAACAALVLCAYPVWKAAQPRDLPLQEAAPLHGYTVVEGGGGILDTQGELKAPAGDGIDAPGQNAIEDEVSGEYPEADALAPNPNDLPGEANVNGEIGPDSDGEDYLEPGLDAAVDEAAANQYDGLLRGMGMYGEGALSSYPDWFAGAWIDHSGSPDTPAWLTVAIVEGFRTPELEARIEGWCGSGVVLQDAKYSHAYLDGLMEPVTQALDGTGLACGIGVDVIANCLGVDLYSNEAAIPAAVLARLAELDPAGDVIRVRVIAQSMNTLTDEVKKGPAPGGVTQPAPGAVEEGGALEGTQPAKQIEELPQAKRDVPCGAAE